MWLPGASTVEQGVDGRQANAMLLISGTLRHLLEDCGMCLPPTWPSRSSESRTLESRESLSEYADAWLFWPNIRHCRTCYPRRRCSALRCLAQDWISLFLRMLDLAIASWRSRWNALSFSFWRVLLPLTTTTERLNPIGLISDNQAISYFRTDHRDAQMIQDNFSGDNSTAGS